MTSSPSLATRRFLFPALALLIAGALWQSGGTEKKEKPSSPPAGSPAPSEADRRDLAPPDKRRHEPSGTAVTTTVRKEPASKAAAGSAPEPDRPGSDWMEFLGPHQTGVSDETGLLDAWPAGGPPEVWKITVGTGYSAPSVSGNRLVIHHRQGNEEIIECLRADTGAPLWKHRYGSSFRDPYGYNNGPRCSPVLHGNHCYTLGAEGALVCTSLETGDVHWERSLQKEFTIPDGFFGMGCSPIVWDKFLIVLVGGQPNTGVAAFDLETGKTVWESVGKKTWDGVPTSGGDPDPYEWTGDEMMISYSSPIVAMIHGKPHLLCLMRQGLVSLDPKTGRENFKFWFRPRVHESVNAARPVVVDDKIFVSAAYRLGSALLQVKEDGQSYDVLWRDPRNMLNHWSTSIALDGHVYGFSGRHEEEGEFRCLDLKTGKPTWQSNGWDRPLNDLAQNPKTGEIVESKTKKVIPYPFYGRGSKIYADGKFIVLAERGGTLALVRPSPEKCDEISRCTIPAMHYPSWTAPVLSRGRLYLRCEDALICLDLKKSE